MLGRAFQYGNYMKVIELSRFVDHCQRYAHFSSFCCFVICECGAVWMTTLITSQTHKVSIFNVFHVSLFIYCAYVDPHSWRPVEQKFPCWSW